MDNSHAFCKNAAWQKSLTKAYTKYFDYQIEDDPLAYLRIDDDADVIAFINADKGGYAFITINPEDDTNFKEFEIKVKKALKKKFLEHSIYNYEWREGSIGLHVHILSKLLKPKKKSHIQREFYNTFKDMVGNVAHIHVKMTSQPSNIISYIQGNKAGAPKVNSSNDILNRKKLKLPLDNGYLYYDNANSSGSYTCKSPKKTLIFGLGTKNFPEGQEVGISVNVNDLTII